MIARCVDVGPSTDCKYVRPVVSAVLQALPRPIWQDPLERRGIGLEFSRLKGGHLPGWTGLYAVPF